jgi:hypothetical protein
LRSDDQRTLRQEQTLAASADAASHIGAHLRAGTLAPARAQKCRGVPKGVAILYISVLSVVATKIRTARDGSMNTSTVGRIYEGYLLSTPVVGRGMVLFRDPNGRRMVTTSVRRVLTTSDDSVLYVETENSVYRLRIRTEKPATAVAGSG